VTRSDRRDCERSLRSPAGPRSGGRAGALGSGARRQALLRVRTTRSGARAGALFSQSLRNSAKLAAVFGMHASVLVSAIAADTAPLAPVSFRKDIAPVLHRRCAACHGEQNAKGGYRLDTFERMGKAGDTELAPLVAGTPGKSELHQLLVEADANDRMPQKADALPPREIALIERWITEGALNDAGANRPLAELVRESLLLPAPQKYARPAPATALAFSPDGTQIAASGYYEVTIWDLETGALVRRIGGLPQRIHSIAWHSKTGLLAVGGGSASQWGGVFLVDPSAGLTFDGHRGCVESPAVAPGGRTFASGAHDGEVCIWNPACETWVRRFVTNP